MPPRFNRKWLKVLIMHCIIAGVLVALVFYGCVFYNLFGIICPACGVTRAWLAFFRWDFEEAFRFHALFPIVPIYILVFIHRDTDLLRKRRRLVDVFLYCATFILVAFNIYRVYFNHSDIFPNGYI